MKSYLGSCLTCIKYLLFVFNFLFWAIGCALVGVGVWVVVDAGKLVQIYNVNVPEDIKANVGGLDENIVESAGIAIIIIGGAVMISGFLGCCGAIRESESLLSMFFAVLVLIFAALVAVGIVAIVKADWLKELLSKAMRLESGDSSFSHHDNSLLSYSYRTYGCCGIDDLPICDRDYPPFDILPKPCAARSIACQKGCLNVVWGVMSQMAIGVGAVALVAGGLVIFGMIFSMCLCCAIRQKN